MPVWGPEMGTGGTWGQWGKLGYSLPGDYSLYPTPADYPGGIKTKQQIVSQEPVMDLGKLLGDVATTYIQTKYGPQPVSSPAIVPRPADWPFSVPGIEGDLPFIDIVKKKRRRRRRRLATLSDIRDLAALKQVLGSGGAFTTWIATHPS